MRNRSERVSSGARKLVDDHGNDVADYLIEFSDGSGGEDRRAAEFFHTEVLESVRLNSENPAYRCFFVDRTDLRTRYYPMIVIPRVPRDGVFRLRGMMRSSEVREPGGCPLHSIGLRFGNGAYVTRR